MFNKVKKALEAQFDKMVALGTPLLYKNLDRDQVFNTYLLSFPTEEQQPHNCNCCKSFLRQWAGLVTIDRNLKVHSIWDFDVMEVSEEYRNSITALKNYIASLAITDKFFNSFKGLGTNKNFDTIKNVEWTHFHLQLPSSFQLTPNDRIDTLKSDFRSTRQVTRRSLEELTLESAETILDLINQGSLYKGPEYKAQVSAFVTAKRKFDTLNDVDKQAYVWSLEGNACAIRNTAVGTILEDLSLGIDLDDAVRKYEVKVAGANYKRTTALAGPKQIAASKKLLEDLGLTSALERRFANEADLNINDILYTDKTVAVNDVFGQLSKEASDKVDLKSFSKLEEVTAEDFINKILPTAKQLEVFVENSHMGNFASLVTAVHEDAKPLFKWANPFSWAYAGGIADSMKERVKDAGGNVDGILRFSIMWNDEETKYPRDMDAHAIEPNHTHISYMSYRGKGYDNKRSQTTMTGNLDVDMTGGPNPMVENITWLDKSKMQDGVYELFVNNYSGAPCNGIKAQVEMEGELHEFHYKKSFTGNLAVAKVTLKQGVFTINSALPSETKLMVKEQWGIKTNGFTKVKSVMLSPNFWRENTGNKHYMFFLEDCINPEPTRPFFNEFLRPELYEQRKAFEMIAGKLLIPHSDNQLSGVSFSETQRNHLIIRVTSTFARTLKIKF